MIPSPTGKIGVENWHSRPFDLLDAWYVGAPDTLSPISPHSKPTRKAEMTSRSLLWISGLHVALGHTLLFESKQCQAPHTNHYMCFFPHLLLKRKKIFLFQFFTSGKAQGFRQGFTNHNWWNWVSNTGLQKENHSVILPSALCGCYIDTTGVTWDWRQAC